MPRVPGIPGFQNPSYFQWGESLKVGLPVLGLYGSYETASDRQRRTVFWSLVNEADEQDL